MNQPFMKYLSLLRYIPVVIFVIIVMVAGGCKNSNKGNVQQVDVNNPVFESDPNLKEITAQLKKDPGNAKLFYQRGMLLHKLKEDTLAIKDIKAASALDTDNAQYYSAIGDIYFDHKDITGALQWIRKTIEKNPKDINAHLKICRVLLFAQRFPEAITEANLVLRQDVYNPEAYFLKGMVYKLKKDTAQAIGNFETAVQVDPGYKDAVMQLGLLYSAKKNPLALKYLDNVAKADSNDVFPIFARGVYYQNNNEPEKAKEQYRICIIKNIRFIDAYFNMGYILMHQDSVEKAFRQYDLITKFDQLNPSAYYDRGVCNESLNKIKDAISDYKLALSLDSTYTSPREALKRLKVKE